MDSEKTEKKIKSLGFTLKIRENKKKEVKKNSLFDAKNFRKPFEEDVVYNDDIKVKEELIKEVEGKKIHAVHEIEEKGPLVIPLIKTNQWRNNTKNETNNEIIENKENVKDQDKKDEKEKITEESKKKEIEKEDNGIDLKSKYGLQIPVKKRKLNTENEEKVSEVTKVDENEKTEIVEDNRTLEEKAIDAIKKESSMNADSDLTSKSSIDAIPILKQNAVPGTENFTNETDKFRYDIQFRPEESTLEDYERIPIEEFGAAMLRGMGWEKGKAVGRNRNNKNAMVEPIQFIPRPALLGLGAQPVPPDLEEMKKKRKRNTMGKEEPPKEYKPHVGSDGKIRHFKTLDEPRRQSSSSRHSSRHSSRQSSRHRESSHHRHSSRQSESSDRDRSRERDRNKSKSHDNDKENDSDYSSSSLKKESSSYTRSSSLKRRESPSSDTHNHSREHSRHSSHHHESSQKKQNSWLYPNIRVRIVSKSFKSGKYYKKKGVVFDVTQQGVCILRLDNGKLLEDVKERYLETLIPDINEIIMVVRHTPYAEEDYLQKVGKVLSKDRNTEKAMVQLEPSMDVVMLSFDDICEFKGNTNEFY